MKNKIEIFCRAKRDKLNCDCTNIHEIEDYIRKEYNVVIVIEPCLVKDSKGDYIVQYSGRIVKIFNSDNTVFTAEYPIPPHTDYDILKERLILSALNLVWEIQH